MCITFNICIFAKYSAWIASGSARLGSVFHFSARIGSVGLGSAQIGWAKLGPSRLGSARLGLARARLGSAPLLSLVSLSLSLFSSFFICFPLLRF